MITPDILEALAPDTPRAKRDRFIPHLNEAMPRYGIVEREDVAAFLATCCFESNYFRNTKEIRITRPKNANQAKIKAMQDKYWSTGYYGRALIQLTHLPNYRAFGFHVIKNVPVSAYQAELVGIQPVPLSPKSFIEKHPELLERPFWAVEASCWFWTANNCQKYALEGNFDATQGIVNKGNPNKKALKLPERRELYQTALNTLPTSQPTGQLTLSDAAKPEAATTPLLSEPVAHTSSDAADSPSAQAPTLLDRVYQPIADVKGKIDSLGVDPGSISKSSFWNIALAKVIGWPALIFGFLTDHWEYILGGLVLVGVAYLVFFGAKRNANGRVLALKG